MAYRNNIEKSTLANKAYRKVLFTTPQQQLVVMALQSNDFIDNERHPTTTQFIRIERGTGIAKVANSTYKLSAGVGLVIPPNTWHYIKNTGTDLLQLYTIYSPPMHPPHMLSMNHI
jgi:mannose-6-phosphate isomerase-like protein (cupin superfamily)